MYSDFVVIVVTVHTTNDESYENKKVIKEREDTIFTWFGNLPTSTVQQQGEISLYQKEYSK